MMKRLIGIGLALLLVPSLAYAGRYKVGDGGACYWEPNDDGPDQCSPYGGRYKIETNGCVWVAGDSGPNQCQPLTQAELNWYAYWTPQITQYDAATPEGVIAIVQTLERAGIWTGPPSWQLQGTAGTYGVQDCRARDRSANQWKEAGRALSLTGIMWGIGAALMPPSPLKIVASAGAGVFALGAWWSNGHADEILRRPCTD